MIKWARRVIRDSLERKGEEHVYRAIRFLSSSPKGSVGYGYGELATAMADFYFDMASIFDEDGQDEIT